MAARPHLGGRVHLEALAEVGDPGAQAELLSRIIPRGTLDAEVRVAAIFDLARLAGDGNFYAVDALFKHRDAIKAMPRDLLTEPKAALAAAAAAGDRNAARTIDALL